MGGGGGPARCDHDHRFNGFFLTPSLSFMVIPRASCNGKCNTTCQLYITGFKFMANKQFRTRKKMGTSVYADISHYALKNQYGQSL